MEERVWFLMKLWYLVGRETRTFNIKLDKMKVKFSAVKRFEYFNLLSQYDHLWAILTPWEHRK